MNPIRVGSVRFLNTRPLIEGLDAYDGLSLQPAVPSHLLGMLESGQVDIALVSVIDALRSKVPLAILPAGMIGSDGPTLTVRLFSTTPIDKVREVWADTDSHTSIALCQVLLQRLHAVSPVVRRFNARERMLLDGGSSPNTPSPHAMLLIGDKVVSDPPDPAVYTTQFDLGELWRQWTGLPFVYATWMCRAEDASRPEVAVAAGLLDRQRRHNLTRLAMIASTHARAAGWPEDLATTYLTHILRFDLGPRERQAVERFWRECQALGLAPAPNISWIDWRGAALAAAAAVPAPTASTQ